MEDKDKNEKKEEETESSTDDTGEGDKSSITKETELANTAAERLEKANTEQARLQAEAKLQKAMGGTSEGGMSPPKKTKPTDEEYADMVSKGLANPLADDGYIN